MAQKISFKLEVFEGPMDLLLRLISKHQLNIYDIEITSLLEQYLRYMDQCREQDLELAGEFLEMAARLIYIKTASLLPRPEEAQKEKQALQGALIEYALCKQAAVSLQAAFVGDQIFTDVCGANLAGIRTILVKPIHPKEEIQIVLKRRLEAIVLLCYRLHRKIVKPKYPSVAKKEDSSIL